MTQGQRPYDGVNDPSREEGQPGEWSDDDATAKPEQEPRAAQGPMSGDVTHTGDAASDNPDAKKPGIADATGPQG